ncbi:response regulator [Mesorhizobium sp. WSM2561]|uniref:response regulator transcription factor n=1 Tax=Mesorhizobium sp. WSM2561 TaxID=1040985 RepID=UPI0004846CBE|nr:response regulator [Mesorhizobium sp. WSM2561]
MAGPILHIAIVDDDASVRRALARLLVAFDIEAKTFATGAEFLESLSHGPPDCLMLDVHMPGMTGLEVQLSLAESGIHLPVIIITAHDEPKAIGQTLKAGAMACLSKPLDEMVLLETIHSAFGRGPRPPSQVRG